MTARVYTAAQITAIRIKVASKKAEAKRQADAEAKTIKARKARSSFFARRAIAAKQVGLAA